MRNQREPSEHDKKTSLFSRTAAASLQAASRQIDEMAGRLGLSRAQLSTMKGLLRWATFLGAGHRPLLQCQLHDYLNLMGYLPQHGRVLANARRSTGSLDAALPHALEAIARGVLEPARFLADERGRLRGDLTRSQLELLESIVCHQRRLDDTDLGDLTVQFPFPITSVNFFGRFIAGGCSEPRKAIRHLRIASGFFVRIRSLLEGLTHDRFRFLVVRAAPTAAATFKDDEVAPGLGRDDAELIHECVNHAADFLGDDSLNLVCIEVPELPYLATHHFESKERGQLAAEIIDWLITGNKSGVLLRRVALHPERERDCLRAKKELRTARRKLARHRRNAPVEPHTRRAMSIWEREDEKLEREIESLETRIKEANRERSKVKSVLRQLEEIETGRSALRRFRAEVASALERGQQIVFSLLRTKEPLSVCQYLDRALSCVSERQRRGVQVMRAASFLLSPGADFYIKQNRVGGFGSIVDQQLRYFDVALDEIGPSLRFILARILPEKFDPQVSMIVDTLLKQVRLPGVSERKHFAYLVKAWSGRRQPGPEDYLAYTFEHAVAFDERSLQKVLLVLRELGYSEIPRRCQELSRERFNHAPAILSTFERYTRNYRPGKLGQLPAVFRDVATLNDYRSLRLDAFGMSEEVAELERHLLERDIVCIVDLTNFHPELATVIHDEKIKDDVEKTREVWGDYVRPHERLLRSFARRLMEGRVPAPLRHHSLVTIAKPDKIDKIWEQLVRKFLGIDLNITPDLGLINKVLSDLTLYDENVILVVDADAVKDLEQYRQFVGLLQRYRIKVILRLREPLPGLPQVLIQPFLDDDIVDRLLAEEEPLRRQLGLETPIERPILEFACGLVKRARRPDQDNLNLVLHTLDAAAQQARMENFKSLAEQDIAGAAPSIFHLPDGEQIRHRKTAVDRFLERAPLEVLGQQRAIQTIGARLKSHVLGVRDLDRPLALLLPGPTGVGKTELMMKFALALNIPFFHVEGAQFSESHTVARLLGSPTGYVGPDKGVLYTFAEENAVALVFFDEIEKMHPDVYTALMNYFDAANLTAGNGVIVRRPGHFIVGAANA
ncbi:MAG: AAA family ATPase, partial [Gemmataceae bacterium]